VPWRVEILDAFYDSLSALDSSEETKRSVDTLMLQATNDPESAPPLSGMFMRVIKTLSVPGFRPLRLFYWLDGEGVHLLHIEEYDELEP